MYIEYNSNPENKLVGDCVIRAISKVTDNYYDNGYDSYNHRNNSYGYDNGYSRHTATDQMINKLEMMMQDASSKDKATIQRCIEELKN